MRGPGSIPTFFTGLFCFHIVKPLLPILVVLPFLCISKKTVMSYLQIWTCEMSIFGNRSI